jgi:hypothetical protein
MKVSAMEYLDELLCRTESVRELTEEKCDLVLVETYASGFNAWLHDAPLPSRPIWRRAMFESSVLSEASVFLAVHGFYEEASAILRTLFEGFLTRLYWDTLDKNSKLHSVVENNGRSTNDYWEWECGRGKFPPRKEIWCVLLSEGFIKRFDDCYHLKQECDDLLNCLDKYVHWRPQSRHYHGATRSSRINVGFDQKHFDEWFENLKVSFRLVSTLSILQCPELLSTEQGHIYASLEQETATRVSDVLASI